MKPTETKTYRLTSTPGIHTPGMIHWMRHLPSGQARKIFKAGWPQLPERVRRGVLDGSITYTVENETVIIVDGGAQ